MKKKSGLNGANEDLNEWEKMNEWKENEKKKLNEKKIKIVTELSSFPSFSSSLSLFLFLLLLSSPPILLFSLPPLLPSLSSLPTERLLTYSLSISFLPITYSSLPFLPSSPFLISFILPISFLPITFPPNSFHFSSILSPFLYFPSILLAPISPIQPITHFNYYLPHLFPPHHFFLAYIPPIPPIIYYLPICFLSISFPRFTFSPFSSAISPHINPPFFT